MKCRICGNNVVFMETFHDCRKSEIGVLCKSKPYKMEVGDLELYQCEECGHIQADYLLSDDFYGDYEGGQGLDQYYGANIVVERQLSKLREMVKKENATLLEIGSGTGNALVHAGRFFDKCIGVDPSEPECEMAGKMLNGGVLVA